MQPYERVHACSSSPNLRSFNGMPPGPMRRTGRRRSWTWPLRMAWARAYYQATEQARDSVEQQQLMDTLVASVVEAESAEKARVEKYADDLQKALDNSESKGNAPMEVDCKGKGKAKPVEVSDERTSGTPF